MEDNHSHIIYDDKPPKKKNNHSRHRKNVKSQSYETESSIFEYKYKKVTTEVSKRETSSKRKYLFQKGSTSGSGRNTDYFKGIFKNHKSNFVS